MSDPDQVLDQLISDMKQGYRQATEQVQRSVDDEEQMRRRVADLSSQSQALREQARQALLAGDQVGAREAHEKADNLDETHASYAAELAKQAFAVTQLRNALDMMSKKIADAEKKRLLLKDAMARTPRPES